MALRLHPEVRGGGDPFLFAGIRKYCAGSEVTFEGSLGFSGDMVRKGWQRAAHRDLDAALFGPISTGASSRSRRASAPWGDLTCSIALRPHATRFLSGDRLQVDIRGKWHYPRDSLRGQFPTIYQPSSKATRTYIRAAAMMLISCWAAERVQLGQQYPNS
jgi:uncharacterized protein